MITPDNEALIIGDEAMSLLVLPMKFYVDASGNYLGGWDANPPAGGIEVASAPEQADQKWLFPGWGPSPSQLRSVEDEWRSVEMPLAQENITALQYGDPDVPGTEAQWKAYWVALRNWKEGNPNYPDITKRPVRPA